MNRIQIFAFSTLLATGLPALAQSTPAPPPAQAKEPEPDLATLRQMKSKLFVIQHRDPLQLQRSLAALGSGVAGATMRWSNEAGLNTIGVRDFPENLASIEEAIKRLDVASASTKTADVELHVQVLFASKQAAPEGSVPEELQPVIKSLKGALAYRGYTLAASFVQRWDPSSGRQIEGKGQIDGSPLTLGTSKDPSQLRLRWSAFPNLASRDQQMQVDAPLKILKFQFEATEDYDFTDAKGSHSGSRTVAQLETSLTLKGGEHVVVGTTMIKDRSLIVVLSAKRVN